MMIIGSKKKMSENMRKFAKSLDDFNTENKKKPYMEREMCPPPTNAQLVVDCLCDLFLGENWYVSMPLSAKQANTVILDNILYKYCKEYKKECANNAKPKYRKS